MSHNSTTLKNATPFIISAFFFVAGFVGFSVRDLVDQPKVHRVNQTGANEQLLEKETWIEAIRLLSTAVVPSGFLCWIIVKYGDWIGEALEKDLEIETEKIKRQMAESTEKEVRTFYFQLLHEVESIRDTFYTFDVPKSIQNRINSIFQPFEVVYKDLKSRRLASDEIVTWLNTEQNIFSLRSRILDVVANQLPDDSSFHDLMQDDVTNFIIWLRESIDLGKGYSITLRMLKSAAINENINIVEVYKNAIRAIKFDQELMEISEKPKIIEDFSDELIERISNFLSKSDFQIAIPENLIPADKTL